MCCLIRRNDVRMSIEWLNDMGMSSEDWNFWWRRFWSPSSLGPSCHFESLWNDYFIILWSFKYWMTSEWRRWCWNDYFLILGWWLMTWMRVEWGHFWSKANALVFFLPSFCPHSTPILSLYCHSSHYRVILSFPHHLPSFQNHSVSPPCPCSKVQTFFLQPAIRLG